MRWLSVNSNAFLNIQGSIILRVCASWRGDDKLFHRNLLKNPEILKVSLSFTSSIISFQQWKEKFQTRHQCFRFIHHCLSRDREELKEFNCMNDSVPCARLFLFEKDTLCRCEQNVQLFWRNYLVYQGPSKICCVQYTILSSVLSFQERANICHARQCKHKIKEYIGCEYARYSSRCS